MKGLRLLFLAAAVLVCQSCIKKDVTPVSVLRSDGLFSFQVVPEGDGLIVFIADSTQLINEFIWDFADGTPQVITSTGKATHKFTKNTTYQVKLTAKNGSDQVSAIQAVRVNTRLSRTFDDLPANERDTIRILHILTDKSFIGPFQDSKDYEYSDHQNALFVNFIKRTTPKYPTELNRLIFKHIVYILSPDEMARFNAGGDPVAFIYSLLNNTLDPLYIKILAKKRQEAVSRIAFFVKDPGPYGYPKYPFAGFAGLESGFFVCLTAYEGVTSHEMGHSFGLLHDTLRTCDYFPLMVGFETKNRGTCGSIWSDLPEFQVRGFANKLVVLERKPYNYRYAVPEYWRDKFPNDVIVNKMTINFATTTPYYKNDIDLSKTLVDALIAQHNVKIAPGLATSISENPQRITSGRVDKTGEGQTVYCPK